MTPIAVAAGASARPPLNITHADTLRALAEASNGAPASPSLVAHLNPAYARAATVRALAELQEAGLVTEQPQPLAPLVPAYVPSPAGRAWLRRRG